MFKARSFLLARLKRETYIDAGLDMNIELSKM